MKPLLTIVLSLCLALSGCHKHDVNWKTVNIQNGCWVNAEGYAAAYSAANSQAPWFWARVLVIKQSEPNGTAPNCHVVTVVEWPDGIYVYDQTFGSRRVTTDKSIKDHPRTIAALWGAQFIDAYYLAVK